VPTSSSASSEKYEWSKSEGESEEKVFLEDKD